MVRTSEQRWMELARSLKPPPTRGILFDLHRPGPELLGSAQTPCRSLLLQLCSPSLFDFFYTFAEKYTFFLLWVYLIYQPGLIHSDLGQGIHRSEICKDKTKQNEMKQKKIEKTMVELISLEGQRRGQQWHLLLLPDCPPLPFSLLSDVVSERL